MKALYLYGKLTIFELKQYYNSQRNFATSHGAFPKRKELLRVPWLLDCMITRAEIAKPVQPCSARVQLDCWERRYATALPVGTRVARAQIYACLGRAGRERFGNSCDFYYLIVTIRFHLTRCITRIHRGKRRRALKKALVRVNKRCIFLVSSDSLRP